MGTTATAAFRDALGDPPRRADAATLVGLEHEYRLCRGDEVVDFRGLIHELAIPGRRLDPGDSYAYRCTSGLVVTCDDAEAEIASPPAPLAPHFTGEIDSWSQAGRALLTTLVPPGVTLDGYSTHLSAAVRDERADVVAHRFVHSFAPAVMVMLDRPGSHGIFVRPRPGRLELCGDYAIGDRLRAATAFFAGAVRACANGADLPPAVSVRALAATGRHGIEIDRRVAFGFDLYRHGRLARLRRRHDGGTIRVQELLERSWGSARAALDGYADPADLLRCDRVVDGSAPLGIETTADAVPVAVQSPPPSPFGDLLTTRTRPGYVVRAEVATWAYTVFEIKGDTRTGYACVPRPQLDTFLHRLDAGALDSILSGHLRVASSGRRLTNVVQTEEAGLWDELSVSTEIVAPERSPALPLPLAKSGRVLGGRPGKPPTAVWPRDEMPPEPLPEPVLGSPAPTPMTGPSLPTGSAKPAQLAERIPAGPSGQGEPGPAGPPEPDLSGEPIAPGRPEPDLFSEGQPVLPERPAPVGEAEPVHPREPGSTVTPATSVPPGRPSPVPPPPRPKPVPPAGRPTPVPPEGRPKPDPPGRPGPGLAAGVVLGAAPDATPTEAVASVAVARPKRRGPRRRWWPAALLVVVLFAAAAGAGLVSGLGGDTGETLNVTGPTVPPTTVARTTSSAGPGSSTSITASTIAPATSAPTTITATTVPTTAGPTSAPTVLPTVPTIVPQQTTAPTAATTTTTMPFEIKVGPACTFPSTTLTIPRGSQIQFHNTSGGPIDLSGSSPPGSKDFSSTLAADGKSDLYTLASGGYLFTCKGTDSGSMRVTAV